MNKVNIAVGKQLIEKRSLGEGRSEAESRYRKCFGNSEGEHQDPKPAETLYAEDGTYGVVGGRGLAAPPTQSFSSSTLSLPLLLQRCPHPLRRPGQLCLGADDSRTRD